MLQLNDIRESTFYKEVHAEGKMEGKIKGKIEGKLELIPRLLSMGMTTKDIAKALDLSEAEVENASTSNSKK